MKQLHFVKTLMSWSSFPSQFNEIVSDYLDMLSLILVTQHIESKRNHHFYDVFEVLFQSRTASSVCSYIWHRQTRFERNENRVVWDATNNRKWMELCNFTWMVRNTERIVVHALKGLVRGVWCFFYDEMIRDELTCWEWLGSRDVFRWFFLARDVFQNSTCA